MAERSEEVRKHYGDPMIVARMLAALARHEVDPDRLTPEMLYPFDQLHGRSIEATREHVARLNLVPGLQVLDIGSGIGGPARYIATTTPAATVTGIDLTDEFVAAAQDLTARCGLTERVSFQQGDALAMPFAENRFDAALCLYVAMNIEAKARLAGEIRRVLRPGAKLVWSEVVLGTEGAPQFPLPWARQPDFSFLVTPETLRSAIHASGLRILEWSDETAAFLEIAKQTGAVEPLSPEARAAREAVMGSDFPERSKNFGRNIAEGRLRSILLVAENPH